MTGALHNWRLLHNGRTKWENEEAGMLKAPLENAFNVVHSIRTIIQLARKLEFVKMGANRILHNGKRLMLPLCKAMRQDTNLFSTMY